MATSIAALRVVSLTLLTIQNCALGLVMTQSRRPNADGKRYKAATAVFAVELGKLVVSLVILLARQMRAASMTASDDVERDTRSIELLSSEEGTQGEAGEKTNSGRASRRTGVRCAHSPLSSLRIALPVVYEQIFTREGLQMIVPASLYVVQNNLQLLAASHLSPTSFQVFSQFKIVTTAIFTVLYLKRHLVVQKWISIVVLTLGVMIFQSSRASSMANLRQSLTSTTDATTGFILIMVACLISGFAGTFTERVLKGSKASIWANNFQLSFFSLIPASLPILYDVYAAITAPAGNGIASQPSSNPFEAFGVWAWSVVALNIVGGLLVAMAVKYADSILKSFAASVAVVLTFAITFLFMGATFTLPSLVGAALVVVAVLAYNGNYSGSQTKSIGSYEALPTVSPADVPEDMAEVSGVASPKRLDHGTFER